jgi:hypothetical protein
LFKQLTIIEIATNEDGGHGLQSQSGRKQCWLDGWAAVPDSLSQAVWDCSGYCDFTIGPDGWVDSVTPGTIPPDPDPQPVKPTLADRVSTLESALSETDETAIALYESLESQQETNEAQDEALIELYELVGGE